MTQGPKINARKARIIAFAVVISASFLIAPQVWMNDSNVASASGTTVSAGKFPTGREYTSAAWDGTYAWIFGGKEGGKRLSDIVRYDPATDQAVVIGTKLPSGREGTSAVFLDGSIYVIGGRNSGDRVSQILKFTPDGAGGGSFQPFAGQLPAGRENAAAGTDGRFIFVFGGNEGGRVDSIVRIDPVSQNVVVMNAKLPTPRSHLSVASAGRDIYVFGGFDGERRSEVLRYDSKVDRLFPAGSMPTGREETSAVFADPFAYVFGGRDVAGDRLNQILRSAPSSQTSTLLDWTFSSEREATSAVAAGDIAIVFGGRNSGYRLDQIVEVDLDGGAPFNLVARTGQNRGEIDLSWQAPADGSLTGPIIGYNIYVGSSSGNRLLLDDVPATETTYTHAGLPNSVVRFYTVAAFTEGGEGGQSNEASASTKRGPPPPLPSPREGTNSEWIKGRAFVFGGYQSNGLPSGPELDFMGPMQLLESQGPTDETGTGEIIEYDPDSGTVRVLGTELPPKCCATAEGDGNNVYLFGGDGGDERCCEGDGRGALAAMDELTEGDSAIYRFNPDTGELTLLGATLPTPACCFESVFDGNLIWLFGGSDEERCCEEEREGAAPGDVLGDIWVFDPSTETIMDSGYDLPIPKCCFAAEYAGGYIYLFGGSDDADERCCEENGLAATGEFTDDDIIRFNPQNGEVVILGVSLPLPKCCLSSVTDGETIYLFGGEGDDERCCEEGTTMSAAGLGGVQYDDIWAFDVATETIKVLDEKLPSARSDTSAVWNGQRAFIFGGDVAGESTAEVVGFEPLAPQATTATAGPGRGQITVDWSEPADDDQITQPGAVYRVYIETATGVETQDVPSNLTLLVDDGLGDGESRTYWVTVVTPTDEGPSSREASATTFTGPGTPSNLEAQMDLGTITLTWDAATNGGTPLIEYIVYRHTDLDAEHRPYASVAGDETSYVDEDCDFPAVQCFYTVTARNLVGEGGHSNQASGIGTSLPDGGAGPPYVPAGQPLQPALWVRPVAMVG